MPGPWDGTSDLQPVRLDHAADRRETQDRNETLLASPCRPKSAGAVPAPCPRCAGRRNGRSAVRLAADRNTRCRMSNPNAPGGRTRGARPVSLDADTRRAVLFFGAALGAGWFRFWALRHGLARSRADSARCPVAPKTRPSRQGPAGIPIARDILRGNDHRAAIGAVNQGGAAMGLWLTRATARVVPGHMLPNTLKRADFLRRVCDWRRQ
jgi:hypothetical protein